MNRKDNRQSPTEADHWFVRRMEGKAAPEDEAAFRVWRQDPHNASAYDSLESLGEEIGSLKGSARLLALANEPDQVPPWRRVFSFSKPILLAASVGVAAVVYLQWFAEKPTVQTFTTAIGEQRTEALPDGSQIILNTNTSVVVEYTSGRREVTLVAGEAMFEVTPQPSRPFVVTAGRGKTAVLGTRFQVRNEQNMVAVTLLEGSVRVMRLGQQGNKTLVPGQQALYSSEFSGISTHTVNVSSFDSWTRGRLEFQFVPLAQVAEEANRYSAYKLRVEDPYLKGMKVSGTFRAGATAEIAQALAMAYSVKANYGKDEIFLTAR